MATTAKWSRWFRDLSSAFTRLPKTANAATLQGTTSERIRQSSLLSLWTGCQCAGERTGELQSLIADMLNGAARWRQRLGGIGPRRTCDLKAVSIWTAVPTR